MNNFVCGDEPVTAKRWLLLAPASMSKPWRSVGQLGSSGTATPLRTLLLAVLRAVCASFAIALPTTAQAYVECGVSPHRYFVGDGFVWIVWKEGGAGVSFQSSTDFKPILATAMTAMTTGRSLVVRYADGTACTAQPATIVGLWLN